MQVNLLTALFLLTFEFVSAQTVGDNIVKGLAGSEEFFVYLYYVVGVGFVFSGINRLKKLGHRTAFMNVDAGVTGPMMLVIIGACLTALPTFLTSINKTIYNEGSIAAAADLAYAKSNTDFIQQIKPVIFIIQLIGMIALLRGFLILSKATGQGAQPGTISKGFIHIIGGVLAVNIVATANVFTKTFGV
jgi:intracellular multiplication protein IcmC